MFDERHFPYDYECPGCGAEETVTRGEAADLASRCSSPAKAAEFVITRVKGWSNIIRKRAPVCPRCVSVLASKG